MLTGSRVCWGHVRVIKALGLGLRVKGVSRV